MNWSKDWPTKPGYYWFYGYKCGSYENRPKRLSVVVVDTARNGVCVIPNRFIYVCDGQFIYKKEGYDGVWQEVILPELPNEF